MPVIARYESWKPTENRACGNMASWMSMAVNRTSAPCLFLSVFLKASLMHMNMKARVSDGLAPVARVYMPVRATVQRDLARLAAGLFPKTEQSLSISPYSMPRCRPDRASMCEAPLFRKSSTVSLSSRLLSPQISALTRAAQASFLNPILSTAAESMSPAPLANPPEPAAELKAEPASDPSMQRHPVSRKSRAV